MIQTTDALPELYETDEVAWLETMAQLISEGKSDELDLVHLQEYLSDMAKRDRREVKHRLAFLIAHVLKWAYQPERRTEGWRATVRVQQSDLADIFESKTLRNHAESILTKAFQSAVNMAVAETSLSESHFPRVCPYSMDALLSDDILVD